MVDLYAVERGDAPLLVSIPHSGTYLPEEHAGRALDDTDWYVERLYAFARTLGATLLVARWSRALVDLDREPPAERERAQLWEPYHDALAVELRRIRAAHGYAILVDAHAARDPRQPDVGIGTGDGRACDPEAVAYALRALAGTGYTHAVDGPIHPGYITRRYGRPAHGVHALRLLPHRRAYLEPGVPPVYDEAKATRLCATLLRVCDALLAWGASAHAVRRSVLE